MKHLRMEDKPFYKLFYKHYTIKLEVEDEVYEIVYYRSPFWTNDKNTLWTFLKDKLCWWHWTVWRVYPNGSRIQSGFGSSDCFKCLFPKNKMKQCLIREIIRAHNIHYKKS